MVENIKVERAKIGRGSPKKDRYLPPCQNIENLSYDYSEKRGIDSELESRFMVLVHFPNRKYRQITHVQGIPRSYIALRH